MVLRRAITASSSAMFGQSASNLTAACGAGAVTSTRTVPIFHPNMLQLPVGGKEKNNIPQIIGAAAIFEPII
jgi:hypothetical protein